jgi:hypothetical protein
MGSEGALEAVFSGGHANQVDVVVHKAIGEDVDPVPAAVRRQPVQVEQPVIVTEEHRLAAIAALCHVMGDTSKYGARDPRHGTNMPASREQRVASLFLRFFRSGF